MRTGSWRCRRERRLLIDCVEAADGSAPQPRPPGNLNWDVFSSAAESHGVVGAAWLGVRHAIPPNAGMYDAYAAGRATHLALVEETHRAVHILTHAGIRCAVVKGVVLAETIYPRPDLRKSLDVDVLVEPARFAVAVRALEGAGYRLLERNWSLMKQLVPRAVRLLSPNGALVDLQWSLMPDAAMRYEGNAATTLLDRARPVRIREVQVPTLDVADTFIHVCVHAVQSGADRLLWLEDVRMVSSTLEPDEMRRRAREWSLVLPVAFALLRAGRVLRSRSNPSQIAMAQRLVPAGSWRVFSSAASRLPIPCVWNPEAGSVVHSIGRAARRDPAQSNRELWRRAMARLRRRGPNSLERFWTSEDPASVLYDANDAEHRDAYFEAVEADG